MEALYPLIRPLLFSLESERAHGLTLGLAKRLQSLGLWGALQEPLVGTEVELWGLKFRNRLGLAAGFDKNGDYLDVLSALGFGHIELGTVTPRPQVGNPQPRLFRLVPERGLINRMGFNNKGVEHLVANLKKPRSLLVVGANIGKNADTPLEKAKDDYLAAYLQVYPYADYVAVNVSSPNTQGLRDLQTKENLQQIIEPILEARSRLAREFGKLKPLLCKFAPDLSDEELSATAEAVIELKIDGAILTNTTLSRDTVPNSPLKEEKGGLSGAPLTRRSLDVFRKFSSQINGRIPLIGVGGIMNPQDALNLLNSGASLLQLYSGLVYSGPRLVREIIKAEAELGRQTSKV